MDMAASKSKAPIAVYVVEDDPLYLKLITTQLELFGYRVAGFTGADTLRPAIAEAPPSAVIVDLMSEGRETGIAIIRELRTQLAEGTPIFVLTGRSDFEARLKSVAAGADGYFTKPVNMHRLVEKLDEATAHGVESPARVLLIDDQPLMTAMHGEVLRAAGMEVRAINDPAQTLVQLAEFRPDVVVCDLHMPLCTGFELARVIRQEESYIGMPIVFLSGDEASLVRQLDAFGHGGDEFLSKSVNPVLLAAVVRARAQRHRQAQALIQRDSLTGLYKHSVLKEHLLREVSRAERQGRPLVFALIDVDHFKQVNDTHGHMVGDRVLMALSRLLQHNVRPSDIAGRYGGEEFALILPDTGADMATLILERLRQKFAAVEFVGATGTPFRSSFSCGFVPFAGSATPEQLIAAADEAMYRAKAAGRNRVELAA